MRGWRALLSQMEEEMVNHKPGAIPPNFGCFIALAFLPLYAAIAYSPHIARRTRKLFLARRSAVSAWRRASRS